MAESMHVMNMVKQEPPEADFPDIISDYRQLDDNDDDDTCPLPTRRKPNRDKGLSYFSKKIYGIIKLKKTTTCKEIAQEILAEEMSEMSHSQHMNIRRRIHDVIQVLSATNAISKNKNEIRYVKTPAEVKIEYIERQKRIQQKEKLLQELKLQHFSQKKLMERNLEAQRQGNIPTPKSTMKLPFLIVSADKSTTVQIGITEDKSEAALKFGDNFGIHGSAHVLDLMGFCSGFEEHAKVKTKEAADMQTFNTSEINFEQGRAQPKLEHDFDNMN